MGSLFRCLWCTFLEEIPFSWSAGLVRAHAVYLLNQGFRWSPTILTVKAAPVPMRTLVLELSLGGAARFPGSGVRFRCAVVRFRCTVVRFRCTVVRFHRGAGRFLLGARPLSNNGSKKRSRSAFETPSDSRRERSSVFFQFYRDFRDRLFRCCGAPVLSCPRPFPSAV